jgi:tetratricopeptide (TPR) repeat protein
MSKKKNRPKNTLELSKSLLRNGPSSRFPSFYVCLALVAITWFVFGQTLRHDFVNFDDPSYVHQNPQITRGVTADGLMYAFTHTHARNWHPLTTISHMLDCQLFGLQAGWHHFTNVLLHTVAVLLLFLVLNQMTGAFWQSAFVASLFAVHPLHVESVAWVSERKDVLSAIFFMLTLGAYVRYVRKPSAARYLTTASFFALGLMSKTMLVTLPFVLLLLDYWPLGRIESQASDVRRQRLRVGGPAFANQPSRKATARQTPVSGLVLEKIPLFTLSALSCVATLLAQIYSTEAIHQLPFMWRLNTAVVSYVTYIWQMFWPAQLGAFYPHPNDQLPFWQILLAIAFLISVSLLAILWRKERPYIFIGWFWYVGMLVPVIGLIQVGEQARADRYTYLTQIGLYVLIVWTIAGLIGPLVSRTSAGATSRRRARPRVPVAAPSPQPSHQSKRLRALERFQLPAGARVALGEDAELTTRDSCARETALLWNWRAWRTLFDTFAAAIIIALSCRAFVQTSYWKNSETLWNHTLAVTPNNDMAHNKLGDFFLRRGDLDNAISHFQTALEIRSRSAAAAAHYNPGGALLENSLAAALARKGRLSEAIEHYEKAMKLRPDYGDPYLNLGSVLFQQGRTDEAIAQWQKAVARQPNDPDFHTILGNAFLQRGLQKDAIAEYERAARISPHDPKSCNSLAWLLATSSDASIRDGNRAIGVAQEAFRLSGGKDPNCLRTLAASYAEVGQFSEAIATAEQAMQIAIVQGKFGLATKLQKELAFYHDDIPLRETSPEN